MAKKAPRRRDLLAAEYLANLSTVETVGGSGELTITMFEHGKTVSGGVGCEHCGTVPAAMRSWGAAEISGCECLCHASRRVLVERFAKEWAKEAAKVARKPRPVPPAVVHEFADTGAAAQYSQHPAAIAGRNAAAAETERLRRAA